MKATDISRPPRGGRGLKSQVWGDPCLGPASPPSRGAWIEIRRPRDGPLDHHVAPLAGGVD